MDWEFEPVAGPFEFTEGPVWTGDGVLFSDIPTATIFRYDAATGECESHHENTGGANGLKFGPEGRLYACEDHDRRVTRYEPNGERTTVVERYRGTRLNSPNDLAFDGDGRLWFTDPRYGEGPPMELDHQSVYRVDDPTVDDPGDAVRVTHDTTKPNGILVSPDDATLYVAQSDYGEEAPTELRAYPIRDDGTLGEFRVLHDFHPHRGVDGMCLTEAGAIVAAAGYEESGPGPHVYVFAPDGEVLARHPFPVDMPTNCAFGGEYLATLYVTAGDGRLYRAETDRQGYLGAPER